VTPEAGVADQRTHAQGSSSYELAFTQNALSASVTNSYGSLTSRGRFYCEQVFIKG
jgi:hypothetical protein